MKKICKEFFLMGFVLLSNSGLVTVIYQEHNNRSIFSELYTHSSQYFINIQ